MRNLLKYKISAKVSATLAVIILCSVGVCGLSGCGNKTEIVTGIDISQTPRQVADSLYLVQTTNGGISRRLVAKRMEKYELDTLSYDLFPEGFDVYSYNETGDLETHIHAKIAKHSTIRQYKEKWEAYGDVVITNFLKGEQMFTDTLYWDHYTHTIFTDCFVKMSSPRGFMQGIGMESDEMARNAEILKPYDSYGRVDGDSLALNYIDTINLVGPLKTK